MQGEKKIHVSRFTYEDIEEDQSRTSTAASAPATCSSESGSEKKIPKKEKKKEVQFCRSSYCRGKFGSKYKGNRRNIQGPRIHKDLAILIVFRS